MCGILLVAGLDGVEVQQTVRTLFAVGASDRLAYRPNMTEGALLCLLDYSLMHLHRGWRLGDLITLELPK